MNIKNKKILYITQAGIIAAIYVALTFALKPISFGEIQLRVAEMLVILPVFTPAAIPGLFIGCLLGNLLGGAMIPDVIFGSLATLAGAALTYTLRDKKLFVATIPPIVLNALIVPFILKYAYSVPLPIYVMMLTVGAGEIISAGVLGTAFGKVLKRNEKAIFGTGSEKKKVEKSETATEEQ